MSGTDQDALDLFRREDRTWKTLFHAWQIEIGSRVVQDVIVPHQPTKPAAHRRQPRVLRAERERLSVPLAVVVEISLVAFEDGARHFHRMLDPALLGPADKIGDGPTRMVGSVLGVIVDQQPFQMFFHELAQRRVRLQCG